MRIPFVNQLRWIAAISSPLWVWKLSSFSLSVFLGFVIGLLGLKSQADGLTRIWLIGPLPALTGFIVVFASAALAPREKFFAALMIGGMAILFATVYTIIRVLAYEGDPWWLLSLAAALLGGGIGGRIVLETFGDG